MEKEVDPKKYSKRIWGGNVMGKRNSVVMKADRGHRYTNSMPEHVAPTSLSIVTF